MQQDNNWSIVVRSVSESD